MATVEHAAQTGANLHEAKRLKVPVRVATTTALTLASPGATIDGVTMAGGDRVLVKNQATASTNGIYVWTSAVAAMTRASDADTSDDFTYGFLVYVREGTNADTFWKFSQTAAFTLNTTAATFSAVASITSISGVTITSATAGQSLVYNGSAWVNSSAMSTAPGIVLTLARTCN